MAFGIGRRKEITGTVWDHYKTRIAPGQGFTDALGHFEPVGFITVTRAESGKTPVQPQSTRRFRFKIPSFTNI